MEPNVFVLLLLSGIFGLLSPLPRMFFYMNQNKTWLEAQSTCRGMFTDLATVYTMADMNSLMQVLPVDSNAVWIGLWRTWVWTSGKPLSNYSNWATAQPNEGNAVAACVQLTTSGWHDWYCNTTCRFVCFDDTGNSTVRFIVISSAMTWINAQIYCRQKYTDLANLQDHTEEQQILSLLSAQNFGSAWIGMISGQWSDAAFTSFRYWAKDQPGEGTLLNGCAATVMPNSGMWNYSDCTRRNPFVCYGGIQPQGRMYHFVKDPMTWTKAQSYCRARFTDLATADITKDVYRMRNVVDMGYNGSVWIGLRRAVQADWGWSTGDATLLNFSYWDAGRPNGSGNCTVSGHSVWIDSNCTTPQYFVCFKAGVGYIGVNVTKSWQDAQSYCREKYTDLATISSPWQQKLLTDLVGRGVNVWVGLFLDNWMWSNQWKIFFRNWAMEQPNSGTGNCVSMVTSDSGKWTVADCSMQYPFICHGMDKLKRKQTIWVKASSDGKSDLNDPSLKAVILNQIVKTLKIQELDKNANVSWIQGTTGKVFVLEKQKNKEDPNKKGC